MSADDDLAATVRKALARTCLTREVHMFGGTAFMLSGNMLVAASPRGLLVRVGKDAHVDALTRVGARPMIMKGRTMTGYVFVDPGVLTLRVLKAWLALRFVGKLPAKPWAAAPQRAKRPAKRPKKRK